MTKMRTGLQDSASYKESCERLKLLLGLTDVELKHYQKFLLLCVKPKEVAMVAMVMYREHKVDEKMLVKKLFIKALIPLCENLLKKPTVANLRTHINNLLMCEKDLHRREKADKDR